MKRLLAAAAAAAALVSASPAQAAPTPTPTASPVAAQAKPVAAPDPVKALKSQFVAGRGVKVSDNLRTGIKGKKFSSSQLNSVFEFGASGIVAADVTQQIRTGEGKKMASTRVIIVGKAAYIQSNMLTTQDLPEGKKWVRLDQPGKLYASNHPVDVFQPAGLKSLITKAKSVKNGVYQGTITRKQSKKTPSTSAFDYRLSLDSAGLPSGFRTDQEIKLGKRDLLQRTADSRYSAWGFKVTIKAPAEEQVIDIKDLGPALQEEIQELPNEALASLRH
ncbi:hypothetical protein ACFOY2_25690 [Nonomuraea purpurea]|uniref:LppX_LprAFG lipoprotein n=1 Tax=Nonomuraea purpurea TaxID=1849276 RepID=A0ABV8GDA1_9ACTN